MVGTGNAMGVPVTLAQAYEMIFGYVLLNDWSARDIQAWEYVPLGPFRAKVSATTISPWIVTREALEPYREMTPPRVQPLLPCLREREAYNQDLALQTLLEPAGAAGATSINRTNQRYTYYSSVQQLTHHDIGGCMMQTGDLPGSGTISGRTPDSLGSLLELSWNAHRPLALEGGEQHCFLEDGDEVSLRGACERDGLRIGFGRCDGSIHPALDPFLEHL